jgi:serine/threonine-protein kinase
LEETQGGDRTGSVMAQRYRIDAILGQGGMCTVYRGVDLQSQRQVAVKLLSAEQAALPEMARRFQREATTGRRIAHPNVVAVLDDGALADGSLFLVQELLDGPPLVDVLARGRLGVQRAVAIARQILVGLGAAHRLGIVHRDVKPDNVILVGPPGKEAVKLVDFGIASNDRAAFKLTAAGIAFGTPEYISPEMAMGLGVDARADLYSVGVVLFQMVTGRLPFPGGELKDLLRAHVEEPPPRARAVAPRARIPAALDEVIQRALKKLPEERFPSAAAMVEALDGVNRKRRRRIALAWVAGSLAIGLGAAATWSLARRAPSPVPVPPPHGDRAPSHGPPRRTSHPSPWTR